MTPLELRKQLLIAESELNRANLVADAAELVAGLREMAGPARTFSSIASSAMSLAAGLAGFRRPKSEAGDGKPSWLQTLFKAAGPVFSLCVALRSLGGRRKDP